ncbi:MAG: ABC transporter substrate-binding protein [Spirochaetaceae bacterium]|nr:ABC transporter substrate-binding protein [Spirochaetaceae bacterium]
MNMRRIGKNTLCLAAAVLFSGVAAASCKKGGDSAAVTIKVWGDPDNQAVLERVFDEINSAFSAEYPAIKLDYQYSGSFDALNVAVQSNSLPDVFWVQGNKSTKMAELARAGFLLPLDQYAPDRSRFPPASLEYAMVDGVTYCTYPCFIDYALVYYNADIFARYGIAKPRTWGDFVAAMETLLAAGITPVAFGGADEWARYWPVQVMAAAIADDDLERIKDGDESGNYPQIAELFDYYREFCARGYFGKNPAAQNGDSSQLAFLNGQAAMIFDGTWNSTVMKQTSFRTGCFAMPGKDGTRAAQSGYSNFNTYAVSRKTAHPEEAFTYVEFLGTREAQQIMANHLASIPVIGDITVNDPMVAEFSGFDKVGNNIYHVLSGVDTSGRPQDVFHSSVLPALMTGAMTGAEGVRAFTAEM